MNLWETGMVGLLTVSVRGAVLITLIFGLRWLGRRWLGSRAVFGCWLIAAAVLLMPWQFPLWSTHIFTPVPAPIIESSAPVSSQLGAPEMGRAELVPQLSSPQINPVEMPTIPDEVGRDLWMILTVIWGLGVIGLASWRGVRAWRWIRALREESEPVSERLIGLVEVCRKGCGLRTRMEIRLTDLVGTPALTGYFRPCLLLPRFMVEQLSDAELRHVILHEMGHASRRDLWTIGLLQFAGYVHWFNPLAWLATRAARHDCELACDEWVLSSASSVSGAAYGRTLIKMLVTAQSGRGWSATVGMAGTKRQLLERMARIGGHRRASRLRMTLAGLVLGSLALVGFSREKTAEQPRADMASTKPDPSIGSPAGRSSLTSTLFRENAVWDLRSVGEVGGVPLAIIDIDGEPQVVTEGLSIQHRKVRSIDLTAKQIVVSDRSDQQKVLTITHPEEVTYPKIDEKWKDKLIKEYLADRTKFQMSRQPPGPLVMSWSSLQRKGKETILLNYVGTGMVVSLKVSPSGGSISVNSHFLFIDQVREYQQKLRQAFLDSLTDGQRARFHGGLSRAINFTKGPAVMKKQSADSQAVTAEQAKVVVELTPAQMKLFQEWTGGTTWPSKR